MNLDRRLLGKASIARLELFSVVFLGLIGGILVIFQAKLLSQAIDEVFLARKGMAQVAPLLWGLLAIILCRTVLAFIGDGLASATAIKIKTWLRDELITRLFDLGPAYLQGKSSGDLIARAVQGIDSLEAYFSQYLPQLALAALIPLCILLFVFPLDLLSGIIFLITAPLIPIFMFLIGSQSEKLTRRQFTALSRMSTVFLDTLQGLSTLKALNQSGARAGKIQDASERYRLATMQVLRITFLSALVLELVSTISTAVVAVEIGLRLLYSQMQFQQAFFILVIAPEFYLPLRQLGLRFHAGASGASAAAAIFEILDQKSSDTGHEKQVVEISENHSISEIAEIQFNNVSFTYPDRSQEAIKSATFSLHNGEMTALVGKSGSGKSTVFQLLLRFIEVQEGQILVNGKPLDSIALPEWRKLLAWAPQQPYLFKDSMAGNIALAKPEATLEEVRRAAALAELDDFIQSLPQGYETTIGERGVRLSGGQAQQVSLARAFLKNAPVLLLDEPASHLDLELEQRLEKSIRRLCQGRMVLVIAHRLPTVESAAQIIVLQGGRVVECGDHANLLSQRGEYARLYHQGRQPL